MKRPTLYIFLNKGLKMSIGKASAQAAHAAVMGALGSKKANREAWLKAANRTIIVLEARDEQMIRNIQSYLFERGVGSHVIVDEGVNEIPPFSITALTSVIVDKDSEHVNDVFGLFNLYRDKENKHGVIKRLWKKKQN